MFKTPIISSKRVTKGFFLPALLGFAFLCTLANTQRASAVSPAFDLEISPSTAYWHIKPGETVTNTLFVKNNSQFSLNLTPELVDFEPDNHGNPILKNATQFPYITITNPDIAWQDAFTLAPNETKKIGLKIEIPREYEVQEHHLTLLFKGTQLFNTAQSDSTAAVTGVMGTNLILYISPDDLTQGKLEPQITAPRFVDSFRPITFSVTAQNTSPHANPIIGKIEVFSPSQKKVTEYTLFPDMVLSKSNRTVRGLLSSLIDTENSTESALKNVNHVTSHFSYHQPFLLGVYTIAVTFNETTRTQEVIAIPFSLLSVLVAIPMLYYLFLGVKKKMKTKSIQ